MRKTRSSTLSPEEELFLQYDEPPDFLADSNEEALEFVPAPQRLREFFQHCAEKDLVQPLEEDGGRVVYKGSALDTDDLMRDYAGTKPATALLRELEAEVEALPKVVRLEVLPPKGFTRPKVGKGFTKAKVSILVGDFTHSARYYSERQVQTLQAVWVEDGQAIEDFSPCFAALAEAEQKPLKKAPQRDQLEAALEGLKKAAVSFSERLYKSVQNEVAEARAQRRATMEGFFEGLEEEYMKEERRLYYHLYYFDRQEKLAQKRKDDLKERANLVEGEERFYRLGVETQPVGLALVSWPVLRKDDQIRCGLTGHRLR